MCLEGTTPQDLPQSALLAFVQISATDPVAIYPLQRFVSIRAIRGQKYFVDYFRCARKRQLQVVSSCPCCRHILPSLH